MRLNAGVSLFFFLILLQWPSALGAESTAIDVRTSYEKGGELTTAQALALSPEKFNPRLARYRVVPDLSVLELKTQGNPQKGWSLGSATLTATAKIWMRSGAGDSARTTACVESAATKEAQAWGQWVKKNTSTLTEALKSLHAYDEASVLARARVMVQEFGGETVRAWRLATASEDGQASQCGGKSLPEAPSARQIREGESRSWTDIRPLARVPLKRWDRQVTARVQLWQGGKALNGQFLVDPTAPQSIVSPAWLEGQGLPPDWVKVKERPATRVRTGGAIDDTTKSEWIRVDGAELSGLKIPVTEFQVAEVELYGQPEATSECCDGVLGADLLTRYVVETRLDGLHELDLYDAEKYRPPTDWGSADLIWRNSQGWVSDCEWGTAPGSQVTWNWTDQSLLTWPKAAPPKTSVDLRCGQQLFGSVPYARSGSTASAGFMAIDGRRLVWDFPQGRLRFPSQPHFYLDPRPQPNRTGVKILYEFRSASRVARIKSLKKGVLPGALVGDEVVSVGGRATEKLAQWELDALLSAPGPKDLEVQWRSKGLLKTALLHLPE